MLWVSRAKYIEQVKDARSPKCKDIADRIGVVNSERIFLKNFPQKNPVTVFNPTLLVRGTVVHVYFRLILGYYKYVSAIARLDLSLEDFEQEYISFGHYPAELVIWPSTSQDIWGAEDPRVHYLNDKYVMTYTGRTYFYFSNVPTERTVPVVAITDDPYAFWDKVAWLTLPPDLRRKSIANKDTVLLDGGDKIFVLHRPHLEDLPPSLWVGEISKDSLFGENVELHNELIENNRIVMLPAEFEKGLGWGAPPVRVSDDEYLLIIHARCIDEAYRAAALLMKRDGDFLEIAGVTPYYIMEPKAMYEMVGDRPLVVFPCGAQRIDPNRLLISYGAADSFLAFAYLNINDILSEMKSIKV